MRPASLGQRGRSWSASRRQTWRAPSWSACRNAWRSAAAAMLCCPLGTRVGERVPHPVDAAALPRGAAHLGDRVLEALVGVRDDQPDAPEAAPEQALEAEQ